MQLGRLERVDARTIWANEATHFTPWLANTENLVLLGEAIGIELEHEATEKSVGPFSADILCKDTVNGNWVLIENQLERTDHKHLGQLITYASGLKAVTIVWIANPFTEEHRSALDWLNEITDEKFNFFGLEVELWRIGDSNVAPKFNVVSKPNDWSKTVSEGVARVEREGLTEAKQLQLRFWTLFAEHVRANSAGLTPTKPQPQHWMNLSIGRSGFKLSAIVSFWNSVKASYETGEIRAEFEISIRNASQSFDTLFAQKEELESQLGYSLTWYKPENANACRIFIRQDADLNDEKRWPEYADWIMKRLEELRRVFGPLVKQL